MEVMQGDYQSWVPPEGGVALTVGVYDGVHRGHQHLLAVLRERAVQIGDIPVVVVTFDRHPLSLLAPDRVPRLLSTVDQKLDLLAEAGVDGVAVLTFDEALRDLSADDFVTDVLVGALGASLVAVGEDFRFGKSRQGDVQFLSDLGLGLGFFTEHVPLIGDGVAVSSSAIRAAVTAGDVAGAADLLGRPFALRGEVVVGDRRGRSIGFPTANLSLPDGLIVPGHGVYAVRVRGDGESRPGVANVGVRPTFDGSREVVEAHLFDFSGDLYGRSLDVAFIARLRGEQRFDGVEALTAQIALDSDDARAVLGRSA